MKSLLGEIRRPYVYLVGAGPGDPGLLTLRAVEVLKLADYVLYDYLASARFLEHVSPQAICECVDQLPGDHPQRWPHIHQRIIEQALQGKVVVHLKGGDPLIFGRGGEEAEALRAAGIPFEIVPGVTAAFAAGAYTEIPLTHREHASAIAIVTGHEHPNKLNSRLDWEALARFPGTLAIYMGVARLGSIARELIRQGKAVDTPAALVHQASTGEQITIVSPLGEIEERVRLEGITSPSLVLIGPVAYLKPERSWFEQRPLLGIRVLITRPRRQAMEMMRRLELLGAVPYLLPAIEPDDPADWGPVDRTIAECREHHVDVLIFTSANGVDFFFRRLRQLGRDARSLGSVFLACIGEATSGRLREYHLEADLVSSDDARSERLAELLMPHVQGKHVVIAMAAEGRDHLRQRLSEVAQVQTVEVYRQRVAINPQSPVFDHLRRGEIHVVTLTSPNIARAFLSSIDDTIRGRIRRGQIELVVNSPRLAEMLRAEGFSAWPTRDPSTDALIETLIEWKRQHPVSPHSER